MKIKSDLARFGRGFVYALNGIRAAVQEERNFRFHLCAAVYAYAAAFLAGLDAMGYALLALCVFSVMAMELMNSAIERAVDKPDTEHWWSAGAAKDMAAGAVLITAVGAIFVGVCLFANEKAITAIWHGVTASPLTIVLWLASLAAAYLFTFRYGNTKEKGTSQNAQKSKQA